MSRIILILFKLSTIIRVKINNYEISATSCIAALTNNIFFSKLNIYQGKSNYTADHLPPFKFQEVKALAPWFDGLTTILSPQKIYI